MTNNNNDGKKPNGDHSHDPSRRRFLKNTGMVAGGVVGGGIVGSLITNSFVPKNETATKTTTNAAKADFQEARQFFTRNEDFLVLQAATEQIYPKDENGPGANELGVPYFIDKQLYGRWGANARDYRLGPFFPKTKPTERVEEKLGEQSFWDRGGIFLLGLRTMNQESAKRFNTTFDKATDEQQIEILQDFEDGNIKMDGLLSTEFFALLVRSTIEGAYSDPIYGGNRNMDGWRMKEFPGAHASYAGVIESEDFQKIEPTSLSTYQGH